MQRTTPKHRGVASRRPLLREKGFVTQFLEDLVGTHRLSKHNDLALLAASVAFFCLFSLLPFLILSFLGSRYLLEQSERRRCSENSV